MNSWLTEFGFKSNPYDTRALSSSDGNELLFGREDEVRKVREILASSSRIPVLIGENGVGKSSIANVSVYRIIEDAKSDGRHFYLLQVNAIESSDAAAYDAFRKSIYRQILIKLVSDEEFLKNHGVDKKQIFAAKRYAKDLIQGGLSTPWVSAQYQSNPNAEDTLYELVAEWLQKCFDDPGKGGFICVLDNLENIGTSGRVRQFLEEARDTFFNMPGLYWILCGTYVALKDALSSRILDGYLAPILISPITVNYADDLIQHRIERCQVGNYARPPIDRKMFATLYTDMNLQLRSTLLLCEEFSEHLFHNRKWQNASDKNDELKKWLDQKAAELPPQEYEVTQEMWDFFDSVTMIGSTEINQSEHKIYNAADEDQFNSLAQSLVNKGLLDQIKVDNGAVYRVTRNGWLVHYRRKLGSGESTDTKTDNKAYPYEIPRKSFSVLQGQSLNDRDYNEIYAYMKNGDLCILPSDSSYTLTGIPTLPGVTKAVNDLLKRNSLNMSLVFGSIEQAAQITQLSNMAYRFIDKLTPGGLTFVARMSNNGFAKLAAQRLYTDGTIGIRLSESEVERQLAKEFPLPTTPIRNDQGIEVSALNEAISIIRSRIESSGVTKGIVAVDGEVSHHRRLSTVVQEVLQDGFWYIKILRDGAIKREVIEETALSCNYRGLV